jgi:hypothetical protein
MARQKQLIEEYARMWPREVFDCLIPNQDGKKKGTKLVKGLELLNKPGVYVLYRNEIPYYIGQAAPLRGRLRHHASYPGARYHNFWNFFCAFVVPTRDDGMKLRAFLLPPCRQPTARNHESRRRKCRSLWCKWLPTSDEQTRILNF